MRRTNTSRIETKEQTSEQIMGFTWREIAFLQMKVCKAAEESY
jgi:hypothetical protein